MTKIFCFHCKKINEQAGSSSHIGRRDECLFCKSDLHVCKNCQMYDVKSYNDCHESSADIVKDKERSNFCDHFKPRAEGDGVDYKAKLLSAAESLFKKS